MRPPAPAACWRIAVEAPARAAEAVQAALGDFAAVSAFEREPDGAWLVEAYADREPDGAMLAMRLALAAEACGEALPAPEIERVPPTDWRAATYQAFPPFAVGRFWIHGSHVDEAVPPGRIGLRIDAATAFGTGEHPTTAGCLAALEDLARRRRFARALDMGCGTGILAFAAAKLWRCPVLAVDIDPESVRVARVNAAVNRVARLVRAVPGDGYGIADVAADRPYDLVMANILARPLMALARGLSASLAPDGVAVLSGLLDRQEAAVLSAHRLVGLSLRRSIRVGVWRTLVLARA